MMIIAMMAMNQGLVKMPMILPPFLLDFWIKLNGMIRLLSLINIYTELFYNGFLGGLWGVERILMRIF